MPMPVLIAHLVPITANPNVHVIGSPPRIFVTAKMATY